jgi:hypothetical protein
MSSAEERMKTWNEDAPLRRHFQAWGDCFQPAKDALTAMKEGDPDRLIVANAFFPGGSAALKVPIYMPAWEIVEDFIPKELRGEANG